MEFFLKSGLETVFLNILYTIYENSIWQFEVKPSLNTSGLYDLQVNCSTGSDYQTHAVKIIEEKTYPFKILHLDIKRIKKEGNWFKIKYLFF